MIIKNGKEISAIRKGNKLIDRIYKGTLVVYEGFKNILASGVPPLTLINGKGGNVVDYKIYGNSVTQSILPSEYQQVEYIEGTGTQYFEIDYIATGNTVSQGKYQITNIQSGKMLFGCRQSSSQNFYGFNWGGGLPYKYYNSYVSGVLTNVNIDDGVHTFKKDKGYLYRDDILINSISYKEFTTPYKMIVFGCITAGVVGLQPEARLFNLQFYDNDILKIDLIPCYRKLDGEIGMYDLVNNVFYTNEGSGTFLKGNAIPSPEEPVELESVGEYDETTGKYVIPIKANDTITNIYLNEPLRKMEDIADYVDYKNQKVYRLIDKKTFDGTENWELHTTTKEDVGVFRLDNVLNPLIKVPQTSTMMTHFSLTNTYSTASFENSVYRFSSNAEVTQITGSRLYVSKENETLESFKTWLSQNKPSIYYPIATPIEETIELPNIPTTKGITILDVETEIQPSNIEITYKGK